MDGPGANTVSDATKPGALAGFKRNPTAATGTAAAGAGALSSTGPRGGEMGSAAAQSSSELGQRPHAGSTEQVVSTITARGVFASDHGGDLGAIDENATERTIQQGQTSSNQHRQRPSSSRPASTSRQRPSSSRPPSSSTKQRPLSASYRAKAKNQFEVLEASLLNKHISKGERMVLFLQKLEQTYEKRVFVLDSSDDFVRQALLKRGNWVENVYAESSLWNLKWCATDCEEDYKNLDDTIDLYNHFQNNRELTTKFGIARNLRLLAGDGGAGLDVRMLGASGAFGFGCSGGALERSQSSHSDRSRPRSRRNSLQQQQVMLEQGAAAAHSSSILQKTTTNVSAKSSGNAVPASSSADMANVDTFFPRCYDIATPESREDFIVDYCRQASYCLVQQHLNLCGESVSLAATTSNTNAQTNRMPSRKKIGCHGQPLFDNSGSAENYRANVNILRFAHRILSLWVKEITEMAKENSCGTDDTAFDFCAEEIGNNAGERGAAGQEEVGVATRTRYSVAAKLDESDYDALALYSELSEAQLCRDFSDTAGGGPSNSSVLKKRGGSLSMFAKGSGGSASSSGGSSSFATSNSSSTSSSSSSCAGTASGGSATGSSGANSKDGANAGGAQLFSNAAATSSATGSSGPFAVSLSSSKAVVLTGASAAASSYVAANATGSSGAGAESNGAAGAAAVGSYSYGGSSSSASGSSVNNTTQVAHPGGHGGSGAYPYDQPTGGTFSSSAGAAGAAASSNISAPPDDWRRAVSRSIDLIEQWAEFADHFWVNLRACTSEHVLHELHSLNHDFVLFLSVLSPSSASDQGSTPQLLDQGQRDQLSLTGGKQNCWIIKPGNNARGSGIVVLKSLKEILYQTNPARLVMKYIERPLTLFNGRKFDIRQWVLVKSFDPLEIYMFSQCYLRLCNEPFDLGDLENRQKHISNWEVNKKGKQVQVGAVASLPQFKHELGEMTGNPDFWQEALLPEIRTMIITTCKSVSSIITQRKCCFEVFGFDIMIDERLKPWLLEVNLSPACEARTPFLVEMLKQMGVTLLDVLLGKMGPTLVSPRGTSGVSTAAARIDRGSAVDALQVVGKAVKWNREWRLEHCWLRLRGALTIQRFARGMFARRQLRSIRRTKSAWRLQRAFRGFLGRKEYQRRKMVTMLKTVLLPKFATCRCGVYVRRLACCNLARVVQKAWRGRRVRLWQKQNVEKSKNWNCS
eukprot:g12051.t1